MPAITVDDTLVLPRIPVPTPPSVPRPVVRVVTAPTGPPRARASGPAPVPRRASTGTTPTRSCCSTTSARQINEPGEAKGAPWHPHRGFETVTYILDGEIAHHDSNGGGGVIGEGDTQWMTAGGGILHDELPTEQHVPRRRPQPTASSCGSTFPPALKMTPPRYQSITGDDLRCSPPTTAARSSA